jgi:glucosamine--fructose-6-phosphate aminotransferase (isomerizing)
MPQRRRPGGTPYRANMTRELERAIASQPDVLRAALQIDLDAALQRLRGCHRVLLIGTGTSHNAAQLGAMALARAGVDARSFAAAEFAHWPVEPRPSDGLIVISHTGETSFARAARERARVAGAPVVGLTAQGAGWDEALEVAPRETAETYTQSYLASLLTLFRLAAALGASDLGDQLQELPERVAGALADPQPDAVLLPARLLVLVGAGPCAVTAAEGALKLREGARLPAEGYSGELLLHGSAVPLDGRDALVLVGSDLDPHGIVALVGEAARREGIAVHRLATREGLDPLLSQLPLTVLVQRLALRLAKERDCDADTVITGAWAEPALWAAGGPPT